VEISRSRTSSRRGWATHLDYGSGQLRDVLWIDDLVAAILLPLKHIGVAVDRLQRRWR
jgi:hypothetical protein